MTTTTTLPPLAREYLDDLRRAAKPLSRASRHEIVAEIEAHLQESLPPGASEAEVRTVLDRLGDPEQIVLAEDPTLSEPRKRRGFHEWAAIILILIGGIVIPLLGWLVGVLLLWTSQAWTVRDKLIGTLLPPGGYAFALLFFGFSFGTSSSGGGSGCVTQISPKTLQPIGPSHCATSPTNGGHSIVETILGILVIGVILLLPLATSVYLATRARAHPKPS